MKKLTTLDILTYLIAAGWLLLLVRYGVTGELDRALFGGVSATLGTAIGHLVARENRPPPPAPPPVPPAAPPPAPPRQN